MEGFIQAFIKGLNHIFCLDAVDHILFLLVLCACYDSKYSRRIFGLITAFTIGHAVTFILVALDFAPSVRSWSEKAIPITIMATAIINWLKTVQKRNHREKGVLLLYIITALFGAVHGLAISLEFKMTLIKGQSILPQVLGVNLGIELAQIFFVFVIMILQFLLMSMFRIKLTDWKNAVSGLAFGAALIILMNKF